MSHIPRFGTGSCLVAELCPKGVFFRLFYAEACFKPAPAYKMLTCIYLCRTLLFFAPYADFLKKMLIYPYIQYVGYYALKK